MILPNFANVCQGGILRLVHKLTFSAAADEIKLEKRENMAGVNLLNLEGWGNLHIAVQFQIETGFPPCNLRIY